MHGYGVFLWPDGKRYEGNYNNDKKHGYGKYYWTPKIYYEGNWVNAKQHGVGICHTNDKVIKGEFRSGRMIRIISEEKINGEENNKLVDNGDIVKMLRENLHKDIDNKLESLKNEKKNLENNANNDNNELMDCYKYTNEKGNNVNDILNTMNSAEKKKMQEKIEFINKMNMEVDEENLEKENDHRINITPKKI